MKPYADSNFFSRLYFELDDGSAEAVELAGNLANPRENRLPVTRLHMLEVLNALEMHVYQASHLGQARITRESAAIAQSTFRDDCREEAFLRIEDPPERAVDRLFEEFVLRHTAARGFRTYDLLHVAQAVVLGCDTFWSFDRKANALAGFEGLRTRRKPR